MDFSVSHLPVKHTNRWGPGSVNTNWGPGPVNRNWGPENIRTLFSRTNTIAVGESFFCLLDLLISQIHAKMNLNI